MNPGVVVIGSSVAGVRTAENLRREGFDGRIVVVGRENALPYDKPPLSKQFLAGTWDAERMTLMSAESAHRQGIELRLGMPAVRLDVEGCQIVLADGTRIPYHTAVIATGASARLSPWRTESGVHVLRTIEDSRRLRTELGRPGPVVVVGGGFIGAEVASTARGLGHEVTVVDPLPAPIGRILGTEIGHLFGAVHHRHGVQTRFGVGVEGIRGQAGDLRVDLTDGSHVRAGLVVVGIGAVPNDRWLADSGLILDDGVLCDEYLRAVGAPGVFAVGDIARWFHPGYRERTRVEHWTNAVEQAACVAHNIAHPDDPRCCEPVEYVWSDQYDWKVQIVGRPWLGTRHKVIGGLAGNNGRGAALYAGQDGLLCGAVTVSWPKALIQCRRLVTAAKFDEAVANIAALQPTMLRPAPMHTGS